MFNTAISRAQFLVCQLSPCNINFLAVKNWFLIVQFLGVRKGILILYSISIYAYQYQTCSPSRSK